MKKRSKLVENNRHIIGSIDLSDMVDIDKLSTVDRKNYLQDAETVYNNKTFRNELKKIIQTQLEFMGMEATDMDQIYVARGTMSCIDLLTDRFEFLHNEYKAVTKPEKEPKDPFNPLPETDE